MKYPAKIKMSAEEYHAHAAVGSSSLRTLIEKSPAHYIYEKENPSESTPSQALGTAIHTAILEPVKFLENSIIEPAFSGTGSRAAKEQWHLENHGKLILKGEQHDQIKGILGSISKHSIASKLISVGASEESLFWRDPDTQVLCKARPDFVREGHILVDIKTTRDASYKGFLGSIAGYGYHVQAAMYLDAATEVYGQTFDEFIIVAVEKEPPYAINVFLIDSTAISEGRALYMSALKTLAECLKSNKFPAYAEAIKSASLPTWAYRMEAP